MKNKGLSNNPKTRKLVANRMMNTRSYMSALAEKESLIRERPFSFQGNKTDMTKYNQFQKSAQTGVPQTDSKLNKTFANYGSKFNRLSGAMEKDQIANKLKKFKTMGKVMTAIKNVSVPGIIGTIMSPKKVGDATLNQKKKDRNPNFPR
jgi:hypothetical protein